MHITGPNLTNSTGSCRWSCLVSLTLNAPRTGMLNTGQTARNLVVRPLLNQRDPGPAHPTVSRCRRCGKWVRLV